MARSGFDRTHPTPRALADWLRITTAVFPGVGVQLRTWRTATPVETWSPRDVRHVTAEALGHMIRERARSHRRQPANQHAFYEITAIQRGREVADKLLFLPLKSVPKIGRRERAENLRMAMDGLLACFKRVRDAARDARATTDVRQHQMVTARAMTLARLLAAMSARLFAKWIATAPVRARPTLRTLRRAGCELQAASATTPICNQCGACQPY